MVRAALYAWKNYFLEKVIGLLFFGWCPSAVGNGMDNGSRKGKLEWVYCFYGNFLWKFCITVFRYRYAGRLKMTGDGMDILVIRSSSLYSLRTHVMTKKNAK